MVKGISIRVVVIDSTGAGGRGPPGGQKLCQRRPRSLQPRRAESLSGGLHPDGRGRNRADMADRGTDIIAGIWKGPPV